MYVMKPILEPDVLALLNNGRIDGDVTSMLDVLPPNEMFLDGLIRASVAYGEARGATGFSFNKDNEHFMN